MKEIILDFINSYYKAIVIDSEKVDYISYENKDEIYIDLGKQCLNNFLFELEQDFEIEEIASNLENVFLVYEFYIGNDFILGEKDFRDGYGVRQLYTVETRVQLITRHYKSVYYSYLNSKEWHDKRNKILEYANYECSRCKSKENLQVHHLNYNTVGNECLGDLEVVCKTCHKKIHKIIKNDYK